jgi:NADPH:quinone reductase-like Zn-dependent oxidoreductase
VKGFSVGDAVAGMIVGGGGMATEVVAPGVNCFKVPPGVDMRQGDILSASHVTHHIVNPRVRSDGIL